MSSRSLALPSDAISYMFMDSKHNLWLSTESAGLCWLNEKERCVMLYSGRKELANNKVVSIEEDKQGCLWMGTYKGLYKYIPGSDSFVHFGEMDNLWVGQFNYHACAQDDKFIYMGSTKGLVWFDPQEIVYTHQTNPVYFATLELLNDSGNKLYLFGVGDGQISLPYDQNFLRYVSLSRKCLLLTRYIFHVIWKDSKRMARDWSEASDYLHERTSGRICIIC